MIYKDLELKKQEINEYLRKEINAQNKLKLIDDNLTIIASNCNGSMILNDLGLQFKSPFVNLFVKPTHFIKYLKRIEYYSKCELTFARNTGKSYPVGILDDIEIHFLHYQNEEEAKDKWNKRTARMNLDRLFVILTERDGCTYQDLIDFDALPIQNKVVFTQKKYPGIKSSYYIPGFEKDKQLGVLLEFTGYSGKRYLDYFDYIAWFNGKSVENLKTEMEYVYRQQVVGIRTHKWTNEEEKLYIKLQQYFHKDEIFFIVDEIKGNKSFPSFVNKISLNESFLREQQILSEHPNPKGLGWLCGDYFYYAFEQAVNAEFYWLIEPDVDFTFNDLSLFFSKYETRYDDAFLFNFSPAGEEWNWTNRGKIIFEKVYQAFYPLSRLSKRAIGACLEERKRLTQIFIDRKIDAYQYPNDEVLAATVMVKNNFKVSDLSALWPNSFKYFSYKNSVIDGYIKFELPSNQVLHPVRGVESFTQLLVNEIHSKIADSAVIHDLMNRTQLHRKDVPLIIDELKEQVFSDLENHLLQRAYTLHWIQYISEFLLKFSENGNKNLGYKFWVYQDNTLVLEIYHGKTNQYAFEYIVKNNLVTCNIFTRKGNNELIDKIQAKNTNYVKHDSKLQIFSLHVLEENLGQQIESACKDIISTVIDYTN